MLTLRMCRPPPATPPPPPRHPPATPPQALSVFERLEARREAELSAARRKAAAFAALQPLCAAAAGVGLYCALQVRSQGSVGRLVSK